MTTEELAALFTAWADAHQAEHSAQDDLTTMQEYNQRQQKEEDELETAYYAATVAATAAQEKAIKVAYRARCAYCGVKPKELTIDHVVPLARGGGHTSENLVPACWSCNLAKATREAPSIPPIRLLL